jgi:hypothetical protein
MTSAAKHMARSRRSHKNSMATARMFMSNRFERSHGKVREVDPYKATGISKKPNIFQKIANFIKKLVSGFRKQDRG